MRKYRVNRKEGQEQEAQSYREIVRYISNNPDMSIHHILEHLYFEIKRVKLINIVLYFLKGHGMP